jgi:hypothetical protein
MDLLRPLLNELTSDFLAEIRAARATIRTVPAKVDRWMAAEQPGIISPADWTRRACASWVAAVDRMSVGDYVQRTVATGSAAENR